jgi:5-formyltetrahydrofolate cyclo-ligase
MSPILSIRKGPLRQELMALRERMSSAERRRAEKRIADALSAMAVTEGWLRVAVFLPWRGEPDLMATWRAWHARGIELALPVVVARDAPLLMQQWQPGAPLIRDVMGLSAPAQTAVLACDTWLLPCVGIDSNGARLGAGKGFYDRTIAVTPRPWPRLIGVCFASALHPAPFADPHDVHLDACVTEEGLRRFSHRGSSPSP